MPFRVIKKGSKFKIVKKSGKTVGTSSSKKDALSSIRARLAKEMQK